MSVFVCMNAQLDIYNIYYVRIIWVPSYVIYNDFSFSIFNLCIGINRVYRQNN